MADLENAIQTAQEAIDRWEVDAEDGAGAPFEEGVGVETRAAGEVEDRSSTFSGYQIGNLLRGAKADK